jgi:hypothetical protein
MHANVKAGNCSKEAIAGRVLTGFTWGIYARTSRSIINYTPYTYIHLEIFFRCLGHDLIK